MPKNTKWVHDSGTHRVINCFAFRRHPFISDLWNSKRKRSSHTVTQMQPLLLFGTQLPSAKENFNHFLWFSPPRATHNNATARGFVSSVDEFVNIIWSVVVHVWHLGFWAREEEKPINQSRLKRETESSAYNINLRWWIGLKWGQKSGTNLLSVDLTSLLLNILSKEIFFYGRRFIVACADLGHPSNAPE